MKQLRKRGIVMMRILHWNISRLPATVPITARKKKRSQCIEAVTTDSRKVERGCLFVPIVGARADGHKFIDQVMKQGALATLSERPLGEVDFPYIQVESSLQAVKRSGSILSGTVADSGCRYHRKCGKDQHERDDCSSTGTEISGTENSG